MSLTVSVKKQLGDFLLNVELQSENGILGILGSSGSGKSITLKCIAGIETPDEGRIVLNGVTLFDKKKRINLKPQQRNVGFLFQNYSLFPHMTVEQNVMCGLWHVKNRLQKQQMADKMIHRMQLEGLEKHFPHQLSGGQQQRTALARILVTEPEILMLDEPFSALDSHLRVHLEVEIKKLLREYDKDVLFVSHSRDEIYRSCDTLAVMNQGSVIRHDTVKEVFRHPQKRQAALLTGCKNIVGAIKTGAREVYVPDWGMHFVTTEPVNDKVTAIGIRAHYFNSKTPANRGRVIFIEKTEEPFEWIYKFRYENANPDSLPVWWRISKESKPEQFPETLGIAPQNIMLLY